MVKRVDSKWGEGLGTPVSQTDDPDNPSFDPATRDDHTEKMIRHLLEAHTIERLTDWDRHFLLSVYGTRPLSRKQHIRVWKIHKKYTVPDDS